MDNENNDCRFGNIVMITITITITHYLFRQNLTEKHHKGNINNTYKKNITTCFGVPTHSRVIAFNVN